MFGAADAALAGSATTLTHWASRAPPRDGRPQLVGARGSPHFTPVLGNKMVPICPPPPTENTHKCVDAEPNYERFPHDVIKTPLSARDDCFALRFSIMSEAAAHALERPTEVAKPGESPARSIVDLALKSVSG